MRLKLTEEAMLVKKGGGEKRRRGKRTGKKITILGVHRKKRTNKVWPVWGFRQYVDDYKTRDNKILRKNSKRKKEEKGGGKEWQYLGGADSGIKRLTHKAFAERHGRKQAGKEWEEIWGGLNERKGYSDGTF